MTFEQCVRQCLGIPELVEVYDKLRGTNLRLRGSRFDLLIDESCGRIAADVRGFIEFVWECIWTRLNGEVKEALPRGAPLKVLAG